MARWTIVAVGLLWAAAPGGAQAPAEQAGAVPQIDEVAIARDRYERITVPVTIGGQGPYRFFIDTGAQATVVTRRITDALEIAPSGSAMLVAMGSRQLVETVEIDDFEFANRSVSGLVTPLLEGQNVGADGILGLDLLQDLRVLIDFREQRMHVANADEPGANRGYEIVVRARRKLGQMIITDARIDGVRTTVLIDTGAQNSVGNPALLERLRARERHTLVSTDVNGFAVTSSVGVVRRMTLGNLALEDVPIGFTHSPAFTALGLDDEPALILGMANLRVFERVAIDFASQKVLFDLPGSPRNTPHNALFYFPPDPAGARS